MIFDMDAQAALLGAAMVIQPAASILADLDPSEFYGPEHQNLAAALVGMYLSGEPLDPINVAARTAWDIDALTRLMASVPNATNGHVYARRIRRCAMHRGQLATAEQIKNLVSKDIDPERIVDEIIKSVSGTSSPAELHELRTVLDETIVQASDRSDGKDPAVSTGFADLDRILGGGLRASQMITVGARPAMGKTAFALNLAAAASQQGQVLFVSKEMHRTEIGARWIAASGRIDSQRVSSGHMSESDWQKVEQVTAGAGDVWVTDKAGISMAEIQSHAQRLSAAAPMSLIVIDYLQLFEGSAGSREQEVAAISRRCKILASEFACPVLVLSQLNRKVEERIDKRPRLADLRESGAIEQDSDTVLFLYRDGVYNPDSADANVTEVDVAKNRAGPCGLARLVWMPQFTKFADMVHGAT